MAYQGAGRRPMITGLGPMYSVVRRLSECIADHIYKTCAAPNRSMVCIVYNAGIRLPKIPNWITVRARVVVVDLVDWCC